MLTFTVILLIVLLLGVTRFGIRAVRKPDGRGRLVLYEGPVRIDLLKRLEKVTNIKRPDKPGEKILFEQKMMKSLLRVGRPALRAFLKAIRVDRMTLRLTVAGIDDPCAAALLYGRLHMVWGALRPLMLQNLRVKKHHVEIGLRFDRDQTQWDGEFQASISLWRSLAVLLTVFGAAAKSPASRANTGKAV